MKIDSSERTLRRTARLLGIGIKRQRVSGLYGFIVFDLTSSHIISGAVPVSLQEAERIIKREGARRCSNT